MTGRSTVYAPRSAAATSQPLASWAALSVMDRGGNAVDAAVAAAAMLNVVEPHMTGMGGDMFALLWSADEGRLLGLDSSGRSGSGMSREALLAAGLEDVPASGPGSVTVPGAVAGWAALLDRFGAMTFAETLAPAIRVAEEGFPVTPIIAGQWAAAAGKLRADPGAAATYLVGGRRVPRAGEWFRSPELAASFRVVAGGGAGAFYTGELGARLVDGLEGLGGFLTHDDLARHETRWVTPLSADFAGHTLWELPPAGQGIAALEMLRILEGLDLRIMGHNSPAYLHHLIEAKKLAFADLAGHVGDPEHMKIPAQALLADDHVNSRRVLLNPREAADRVDPGTVVPESETIYLCTADEHGNMVSFINSLYEGFGSGVVIPGTGFALQNRGACFTFEEGHPNQVAPRKKPLHTIIPAFVTHGGEPWLAFGVMGGSMQPQGHVQVLLNLLVFGMDLQAAIEAPRFRHTAGRDVAVEGMGRTTEVALALMGHHVLDPSLTSFGGGQAVMRLERGWAAGSDPRKDGMAVGR
ncbi:MAG: gamma-glutamyltransferase family protein [Gammaproteobacteria bacterium]|nr:gamma-glutamyltransferase family protein [Gammaproteobacteria bacterium]MDE0651928.1 gamma-glutamyltransferase family protein [Gammaproteobacteria bacterium]